MDFQTFTSVTDSVFEHNFQTQKKLESDNNIITIGQLKSYINDYPLADIFLHYPNDEESKDLTYCFSLDREGPIQLLPIFSVFLSEEKIVFSYLSQKELDALDFSNHFKVFDHYLNSARIIKRIYNENLIFTPQNGSMLFMQHIPDSLNWNSNSDKHKAYHAFSFLSIANLMLWEGYFFTPHY